MASCYRDDATFSDPVFVDLDARRVTAMWRMFCMRGTDLAVGFRDVDADDRRGSAMWYATYTFASTGRHVHNRISAAFEFRDGKILRHIDRFSFYRWSRMALGPVGLMLGWTPIVRAQVRKQASAQLEAFMARKQTG